MSIQNTALARAAASPQEAAIYLTAAFTGLRRGELVGERVGPHAAVSSATSLFFWLGRSFSGPRTSEIEWALK